MGLDNPLHIAVLVLIVVLVFGAKRVPEIGRSLGKGLREFRDVKDSVTGAPAKPTAPALTEPGAALPPAVRPSIVEPPSGSDGSHGSDDQP